jgi:O-antigen ligase
MPGRIAKVDMRMRLETWRDAPRGVKVAVWAVACLVGLFWVRTHLADFRNTSYLGGLIVIQIVLVSLWHFETVFFPLLMGFFFWAGMDLPWIGVASTARWFILAVAAVGGFVMWMREAQHTYTIFHLVTSFCVAAALVSAMVSADPATALLKVLSLFLLFAYGATGARLAIRGREAKFVFTLLLGCEITAYVTGAAYIGGAHIWGNPNSLGAIMGVAVTPFLLWGLLIAETRMQRYRRLGALAITGVLLYTALSRAGMLAATISSLTILIALRRQRLLIQGAFVVFTFVAIAAMVQPSHFDDFVTTFTSNVIHKGRQESLFKSRKTPWEETVAVIKEHPWFGSGFGTSDMGQFAQGTKLSLAPSAGGLYTREGGNREHGSSYLALAEYLGLLGILPFTALLFLVVRMIVQVFLWMRRTSNPYHCAIPLAMMLLSGVVHAFFEDWLLAVGYYLCVFFWIGAFWLVDLMPAPVPVPVRGASTAHPRSAPSHSGILAPTR